MVTMKKQRSPNRSSIYFASIDVSSRALRQCFFEGNEAMKLATWAALGASLILVPGCTSFPDAQSTRGLGEKMVADGYPGMPEALTRRAVQDRAQLICSKIGREKLSQDDAAEV